MLRDEVLRESEPVGRDAAGGYTGLSEIRFISQHVSITTSEQRAIAILHPRAGYNSLTQANASCRIDFWKPDSTCEQTLLHYTRNTSHSLELDWLVTSCDVVIQ